MFRKTKVPRSVTQYFILDNAIAQTNEYMYSCTHAHLHSTQHFVFIDSIKYK